MTVRGLYPVLMVDDVAASAAFFRRLFGLRAAFEADWYVHLVAPEHGGLELAIMQGDHETIPATGRGRAAGLLVNVEVDDVDGLHARAVAEGVPILQPLRDEAFGQRHFILRDPNGVLVDVVRPIPPAPEFAAHFAEGFGPA